MTRGIDASAQIGGRTPFACGRCGRTWLATRPQPCPACWQGELAPASARIDGAPEQAVPFALDRSAASQALRAHLNEAPFPCAAARGAGDRLTAHWVPMWLVDGRVVARWQADIGFDTPHKSTIERLDGGTWRSIEVTEVRPRWEGRAGVIDRWYDNVEAPALVGWSSWQERLDGSAGDRRGLVGEDPILVPDLPVDVAWPNAEPGFRERIAHDVARASGGQHARELFVDARWEDLRWTWLLLPVWSVGYVDPRGRTRVLRVDGATGRVTGPVVAGMHEATFRAGLWAAAGLSCLFLAALVALPGILIWPLLLLSAAVGFFGFVLLSAAVLPFLSLVAHNGRIPDPPAPDDLSAVP